MYKSLNLQYNERYGRPLNRIIKAEKGLFKGHLTIASAMRIQPQHWTTSGGDEQSIRED